MRHTIYQSIRRHFATNFPILFPKIKFSKLFGLFLGAPGAFAPHFRNPLLPLHIPKIFLTFDLNSHFLLHGTAKRLNCTLIRPSCTTPRGAQPMGPRRTWPAFFLPHPSKRWSLTSTVTPTPLLYSFFSFSPKSMVACREGHTYFLRKTNFQNFLGGVFPGPQGLLPLIFDFPYSRCISSNFFRRFYPTFHPCISRFIPGTPGLD